MIDPVIGKLSKEYERKLNCYKLNTDENPDIATQFGIRSIPTMLILKNGEKKGAVIGAVPESTLVTCIEKYVERHSKLADLIIQHDSWLAFFLQQAQLNVNDAGC